MSVLPDEFVPLGLRGLHGTEIDGVPVVWEPESTWATSSPMIRIFGDEDEMPGACSGDSCWCGHDDDLRPTTGRDDPAYTYWSRYTPDWPPPRF